MDIYCGPVALNLCSLLDGSCFLILYFTSQIIEVCLVSLMTSVISFGLPLLRKCIPCPTSETNSGFECPIAPRTYGNHVDVNSWQHPSCTTLSFIFSCFIFYYVEILYIYLHLWPWMHILFCMLLLCFQQFYCLKVCFKQFYCLKGNEYNDLTTIFFNTQV